MQGASIAGDGEVQGWVADPPNQPHLVDAWIERVEAAHQADSSTATLAPPPPDLDALMQEWSPEMQAHIQSSPLPDPGQDLDVATFARMCCGVLDLQPGCGGGLRGLAHSLHALFCLYLEFRWNPAFQHRDVFGPGEQQQDLI